LGATAIVTFAPVAVVSPGDISREGNTSSLQNDEVFLGADTISTVSVYGIFLLKK
jgi:hypothetical protein